MKKLRHKETGMLYPWTPFYAENPKLELVEDTSKKSSKSKPKAPAKPAPQPAKPANPDPTDDLLSDLEDA